MIEWGDITFGIAFTCVTLFVYACWLKGLRKP